MSGRVRRLLPAAAALVCVLATAPAASATNGAPSLHWNACGDAPDVECTVLKAPLDYDKPNGERTKVFVARSHATGERKGSLFLNFGGPGASIADFIQAAGADGFPALSEHFDLIGMDPRGTGQSEDPIDCKVNQETTGIYSQPFTTPFNLDVGDLIAKDRRYVRRCLALNSEDVLEHASTANVARDMDLLRKGLGENRLNYLGFSYGTLPGHPESGEEQFLLELDDDRRVRFTISAISRPASPLAKLSGSAGRAVQSFMTKRYLHALDRL